MKHTRILCFLLIVSMISLTGCMDVKDMSEGKSGLVAEYAAGVLLRYSDKYEHRLITREQLAKQEKETEETSVPAGSTVTPTVSPASEGSGTPGEVQDPEVSEVPEVSLDELYQLKGIKVSYDSCRFTKRYGDGDAEIHAMDGETLFVVTFAFKNVSGAGKKVNLMDKREIQYTLDVDGNQFFPGVNILPNGGLNYLDTTIKKGKTEKAVLIFRMDQDRTSASSMVLTIEENNKKSSIKIK